MVPIKNLNPLRWTWFAVVFWCWSAFVLNYPPSVSYEVDNLTGELAKPTYYTDLTAYRFPMGWPFHDVEPDMSATAVRIGAPPPKQLPTTVSVAAMVANAVLIAAAVCALVFVPQHFAFHDSLRLFLTIPAFICAHLLLPRAIRWLAGWSAVEWFSNAVYFAPIPLAILVALMGTPDQFNGDKTNQVSDTMRSDDHRTESQ